MKTAKEFAKEFAAKELTLLAAYYRAEALQNKYLPILLAGGVLGWPYTWDFNLIYDLQYRLKQRITDVRGQYYDWHFQAYGWNAY